MRTSAGSQCSLCSDHLWGHHATTCKRGGDVVIRHNNIRRDTSILAESFRHASITVQCEDGCGLSHDNRHTRLAEILVPKQTSSP